MIALNKTKAVIVKKSNDCLGLFNIRLDVFYYSGC